MKRREFLVAGATLSIAASGGCTGCVQSPRANLRMTETDDLGIAQEVTFSLEDGSPVSDFADDVVRNGTTVVNDTHAPFPEDRPFVHGDSIYRATYNITHSRPAEVFGFTLNPAEETGDESEIVRFEDLPTVDREKLASRGWDENPFLGIGSSLLYFEPEIPASALVPEPKYSVIEWDADTRGRFSVDGSYSTEVNTYRYTSEQAHPSAKDFGRTLRSRHEFTLSGLSAGERAIVTEAIENEHGWAVQPNQSPPNALYSLIERFSNKERVLRVWEEGDDRYVGPSGNYVVRYERVLYWTGFGVDRDLLTESEW